ncbi:hypothetical protein Tco_1468383 [Tanacetum coccineum]
MNMVVVWNPSTRKSFNVVVPNVFHGPYENVLGFGVCGDPGDVKIVKVTYVHIWRGMQSISSTPCQVEVFELSSGVWRIPCGNLPRKSVREEFNEIYLPERLTLNVDFDYSKSKLKESLVVLEYNIDAKNPVYSVWMMEDGVLKSFAKIFTINTPGAPIKTILEFRKNGDIIVETPIKDYEAALEVYEHCSEHINGLGICTEVGSFNVPWKQSLYFRVYPEIGVGSVYISPPTYPASAVLDMLLVEYILATASCFVQIKKWPDNWSPIITLSLYAARFA